MVTSTVKGGERRRQKLRDQRAREHSRQAENGLPGLRSRTF
jgi:hypothetical protein